MSPNDDENRWRGTSSDERIDERRDRMLVACRDIVGKQGGSALAVRAVCRAASVSPRHFYECFPDTDSLLLATYEQSVQQLLIAVTSAAPADFAAGAPDPAAARRVLRSVFDTAISHLEKHPEDGRIIFGEALTNNFLRTHAVMTLPKFMRAVKELTLPAPAKQRKARYGSLESTLLAGGLAAVFIEWLSGTSDFSRDDLITYCTDITWAVLSTQPDRK